MVFQSFNLFPHLTVLENVTLAPKRFGTSLKAKLMRLPETCFARWELPTRRALTRKNCREGSSSASPLPAPLP